MSTVLKPESEDQVKEAVAWAAAEETPLELFGRGTKAGFGRPRQTDYRLDLSALTGIRLYEPEELVMAAGPGTPMAEIEAALAEQNQQLAFEPADFGPLYGGKAGAGTIGGALACNLSGPRRIRAGAARDHILGVRCVTGRGEVIKSGGRVVKNVTGYDLSKLIAGSHGTLAAMTEVIFKVLPAPEKTRTALVFGLDDAAAIAFLSEAGRSPHDVSGLAHLPAGVAARSAVTYVADAARAVTAVRLEGPAPSVEYRLGALREMAGADAAFEELHGQNSAVFWRELRDVAAFAGAVEGEPAQLWRVSVTPMQGPEVVSRVLGQAEGEAIYDWAGGLVWLALAPAEDGHAAVVRAAAAAAGGHATLLRAADAVRAAVAVFEPQPAALAGLTARIKDSFDPRRVLNPGRMYAGV